jgi:hypothetical protein
METGLDGWGESGQNEASGLSTLALLLPIVLCMNQHTNTGGVSGCKISPK